MPLPTNLAKAHVLILRKREELAAAAARASGAEALIAHMKLVIAKLRREQYGQSSERGRKVLDQLELQLEELEAETSENAVTAEDKAAGGAVKSFALQRPVCAPLPAHLPRERVVIPAPCTCLVCGGRLAKLGEDITETLEIVPRQWKVIQTVREKFTCRSCERMGTARNCHPPRVVIRWLRSGWGTFRCDVHLDRDRQVERRRSTGLARRRAPPHRRSSGL
jgi:transposase